MKQFFPKIKTLSQFAGIGGFSLAARSVGGFDVQLAIEIDPFRQKVLRKNFPELKIHDDVCTYKGKSEDNWDLLITTFPCIGMSSAGNREGYKNSKSALWWESYRIIKETKPKFIIIENVFGFIQRGLRECLASLRMAGYQTETPQIISAKEVGACHERKRVFVVAYRQDLELQIFKRHYKKNENPTHTDRTVWWRGQKSWSRQIGNSIEAVRSVNLENLAYSFGIKPDPQSQPRSLSRGNGVETEAERPNQERFWTGIGGYSLSRRENPPIRVQFPSPSERVANGVSTWMDGYYRDGWWLENPFVGETAALKNSVPDRQKRMAALGDSCTPQQAAIPLLRVKYLWFLYYRN